MRNRSTFFGMMATFIVIIFPYKMIQLLKFHLGVELSFDGTETLTYGSIFGKRYLLVIDHIMLALFWSYVPNMK